MLFRPHRRFLKCGTAVLTICMLASPLAYAQEQLAQEMAQAGPAPAASGAGAAGATQPSATAAEQVSGQSGVSGFVGSLIPGFNFAATVNLSESYATNVSGYSTGGRSDWVTNGGIGLTMNNHSPRVSFDANYNGSVYVYAGDTQSTQFTNDLQALGTVIVIPDYVNFNARAFAQPVVSSNLGIVTAGNQGSNGFRNAYGFSGGPDITFRLGNFASSITSANFGAAYFDDPNGYFNPLIPGVRGPQNMTSRSFSERLVSGPDFTRLTWTATAMLQESDRPQGLFSEKAALGHFRFAITREISLLGTGGYDHIDNTIALSRNLSGPVGMGGIGLTLGEDFALQFEIGQKYNDLSYQGSMRWNIGPTASLIGTATDTITTPEGQMLDNLAGLTASANGALTSGSALYGNGTAASLSSFSAQGPGALSYNQNIARYQNVTLTYSQDFARDHATASIYLTKQEILDTFFFFGQRNNNSWGTNVNWSHDLTRLMQANLGGGYTRYQELGGHAGVYNVNAGVNYSLSPETSVYLRGDYLRRDSSTSLQTLSPFTGSLDDIRITLGLSHRL